MPRGKYVRKNKRNENALTTRLMQISLKMDDHIYYDKLICPSEASGYLQEIASLKLQCLPTNVRALQVIEKLTRCMRSIILEDDNEDGSSSYNKSVQIRSECAGSASPVYSLPDEDRTCEIEDQGDVEILDEICISGGNESPKRKINVINTSHKEPFMKNKLNNKDYPVTASHAQIESHNLNDTIDDTETIDMTNTSDTDETKDAVSKEQNGYIQNVNISMSNMAIQDEVSQKIQTVDDNICSQSVLNNYDSENINKSATEKTTEVERNSFHKVDAKEQITNNVNNYFTKGLVTSNPSELSNSQPIQVDLTGDCTSLEAKPTLIEHNTKKKRTKLAKGKDVPTKANPKSTENASAQSCLNQKIMMTNGASKRNNVLLPSTTCKTTKRRVKNKPHELYKNNVVNDLSWVENLRYVREICPEEYDPTLTLLSDSFWDNFSLPDSWNDLDFEY